MTRHMIGMIGKGEQYILGAAWDVLFKHPGQGLNTQMRTLQLDLYRAVSGNELITTGLMD